MATPRKTTKSNGVEIVENDIIDAPATAAKEVESPDADMVKFDVEFKGRILHLTAPMDLMSASADAYIAYEKNQIGTMLKEILGMAQWQQLIGVGMTTRDMIETVWTAYQEATGAGED